MTPNEAKSILRLYRPGTADTEDPQVAAALALAQQDAELGRWLEAHNAQQAVIRAKFRHVPVPAGLKEQIISEQAALERSKKSRYRWRALAAAACVLLLGFGLSWYLRPAADNTLPEFQQDMIRLATGSYGMDLNTNSLTEIRSYLAQHQAPADFKLSTALAQATVNGCAVEHWQNASVTLVCFHSPKTSQKNNLWLFVVDHSAVSEANLTASPVLQPIHRLPAAVWVQDGKLYLLGTQGTEEDLKSYL